MANLFEYAYNVSIGLLPVAAVAGVLVPYLLGVPNFSILGLYLAVPMVLASAALWRIDEYQPSVRPDSVAVDWRALSAVFHVAVAILIFSLSVYEVRPLAFHAGLAFLYALTLILLWVPGLDGRRTAVCLYHTIITITLAIFSVTLKYDFFVGRTDLTAHVSMVNTILETDALISTEPYAPFQLWHVYTATTHQLFGGHVATHTTMYLLSGLLFGAGVLAMYGLARRVYPNGHVALLAPLLAISYPFYIFYGMYSIPRSVTSILFLTLLITLVGRPTPAMRLLGLTFIAAIVLYHPASIPFVFVLLLVVYAVERVVRSRPLIVENVTLAVVALVTLTYWLYTADFLVERIVGTILASFFGSGSEPAPQGVVASPWAELASYAPFSFFVFFVLLGALLWLRTGRENRTLFAVFGISALLLLPLSFPGPALLLDSLVGVNIGRFGHYTFMFFSLTGAVGVYRLLTWGGPELFFAIVLVLSLFAFTAVSTDFVATDNPAVERPFFTYYLTAQERQSYEDVDAMYVGQIDTDRPSCRYLREMVGADCMVVDAGASDEMFAETDGLLIRHGELENRPLQFTAYVKDDDIPHGELEARDRVYDSGSSALYV